MYEINQTLLTRWLWPVLSSLYRYHNVAKAPVIGPTSLRILELSELLVMNTDCKVGTRAVKFSQSSVYKNKYENLQGWKGRWYWNNKNKCWNSVLQTNARSSPSVMYLTITHIAGFSPSLASLVWLLLKPDITMPWPDHMSIGEACKTHHRFHSLTTNHLHVVATGPNGMPHIALSVTQMFLFCMRVCACLGLNRPAFLCSLRKVHKWTYNSEVVYPHISSPYLLDRCSLKLELRFYRKCYGANLFLVYTSKI